MSETVINITTASNLPSIENGKVTPPSRKPNTSLRPREYLTPTETDLLMQAAKSTGRHGHRDLSLILISYRHALRVSEVIALRWDSIDFSQGIIHVNRLKNGVNSTHPISGSEIRALRKLKRDYPESPYIFASERGGPLTTSSVRKMVTRAGNNANLGFSVHPHMLRHAAGYKLANDGHDTRSIQLYMGHRNIQHTVRYTELNPDRFKSFWRD